MGLKKVPSITVVQDELTDPSNINNQMQTNHFVLNFGREIAPS